MADRTEPPITAAVRELVAELRAERQARAEEHEQLLEKLEGLTDAVERLAGRVEDVDPLLEAIWRDLPSAPDPDPDPDAAASHATDADQPDRPVRARPPRRDGPSRAWSRGRE